MRNDKNGGEKSGTLKNSAKNMVRKKLKAIKREKNDKNTTEKDEKYRKTSKKRKPTEK